MAIRARLTAWYGAVLAAIVVVLGVVVWLSAAALFRASVDEALHVQAADVRAVMDDTGTLDIRQLDPAQPGIFTAVFGPRGELRTRSRGFPALVRTPPIGGVTEQPTQSGAPLALFAESAPGGLIVVVATSLAGVDRNLVSLATLLVVVGVAGVLASLVGGWLLAGRALAPVSRLTQEVTSIGAADLERRLPAPRRLDEIGRLAVTLNGMLDRVAASVGRERAFVSAASHDLRTPIATLRTELELAERARDDPDAMVAAIRDAHADAVRLSNLAADLLGLAEAEATGRALVRRPVALRDLVDGAVARITPLAVERSIDVRLAVSLAVVDVDRIRIEQALVNLLANAIRETPEGSRVEIEASVVVATGDEAELEIAVLDRGPGVPSSIQPVLFVPFATRARGRTEGTGLGLATAAAAVHAHGGSVSYVDRPGGGAAFRLVVPTRIVSGADTGSDPAPAGSGDSSNARIWT
jgi:signal transduction histidine kinase